MVQNTNSSPVLDQLGVKKIMPFCKILNENNIEQNKSVEQPLDYIPEEISGGSKSNPVQSEIWNLYLSSDKFAL
jgi:hypothetical protein